MKLRGCRPFDESLATRQATLRVLEMLRAAAVDDAAKAGTFDGTYVSRAAHSPKPGAAVVRRATGRYLNAFHRRLATREGASTDVDDGRPLSTCGRARHESPSSAAARARATDGHVDAIDATEASSSATVLAATARRAAAVLLGFDPRARAPAGGGNNLIDVRRDRHDARAEGALHFRRRRGVPAAPGPKTRRPSYFQNRAPRTDPASPGAAAPVPGRTPGCSPRPMKGTATPPRAAFMGRLGLVDGRGRAAPAPHSTHLSIVTMSVVINSKPIREQLGRRAVVRRQAPRRREAAQALRAGPLAEGRRRRRLRLALVCCLEVRVLYTLQSA